MALGKTTRLNKVAREFNIGISTIVDFLHKKGHEIESSPNTKISPEIYTLLVEEFQSEKAVKEESRRVGLEHSRHETITIESTKKEKPEEKEEDDFINITSTSPSQPAKQPEPKKEEKKEAQVEKPKAEKELQKKETAKPTEVKEVKEEKQSEKDEEVTEEKKESKKETPTGKTEEKEKEDKKESKKDVPEEEKDVKVLGKIDLSTINTKTRPDRKSKEEKEKERQEKYGKSKSARKQDEKEKQPVEEVKEETSPIAEQEIEEKAEEENFLETEYKKLSGPKVLGKIDLPKPKPVEKKPKKVASSKDEKVDDSARKKKRKRIRKPVTQVDQKEAGKQQHQRQDRKKGKPRRGQKRQEKPELSEEEIQKQIKETLSKLTSSGKSKASKHRRQKRDAIQEKTQEQLQKQEDEKKIIKVTEFVTANELGNMMNVSVTEIISTCMSLGLFVSINQRLDAETITIVAEEFGYEVDFVSIEVQEAIQEEEKEDPANLIDRHPIVTVMGHVDHGKTSLLDHIRKTNVIAGEAGGITQHIGAYEVMLDDGRKITFLDTPGHEAFTAMRARGAKVTDVAIIVVAADDNVMPQTKEAINHAKAADVPLVFAINKIDKPGANPEKIKEELANMNILVEDWGGKFQSQDISAKQGQYIDELLEKVLLEAEVLELKANPNKPAKGTILESSLDKGRGYVTKVLVEDGTLKIGDIVLAGYNHGKVKAMYNERNQAVKEAGPATPVLMLGLNGAPQAGDGFNVMKDERETKSIATKRMQLQREQGLRTQKHITLDEIGRRIAIGEFKELNIIVKGDVDGSVEALSDSLLKLSKDEVQVNIIHKSVGQISETDVMLATASDAVIVGFQVRPSLQARKLAETEQIDIRLYSVIYQAIEEIKSAIEGMLAPTIEEEIVCNIEVRDVFKISKVGTVAGCYVMDGKVNRNTKVRVIRDGIVIYTGLLGSLKRFKDDVKEVLKGYECGLNIENFNDIKVGDVIEGYTEKEVKRTY